MAVVAVVVVKDMIVGNIVKLINSFLGMKGHLCVNDITCSHLYVTLP
jgi:hypothetical protein